MNISRWTACAVLACLLGTAAPARPAPPAAKRIAFIIDSWYLYSHADVIGTRLLEGYRIGNRAYASPVTVARVYADEPRPADQTRQLATRYGFRVAQSIADALLDDPQSASPRLAVDGILLATREELPPSGQLPSPSPRLRTFREILRILDLTGARVPIFIDKMIAANWQDSLTIVAEAKRRGIPLMGGSVLSYMPPDRPVTVARKVEVGAVISGGPYWAYAFHAAEFLQSAMEQRAAQESGVTSVQEVGTGWWTLHDRDRWGATLLEPMLAAAVTRARGRWSPGQANLGARVVLIQYADGSRGVLAVLPRAFDEGEFALGMRSGDGQGFGGVQLRGPPFEHFGYLAHALVEFYSTGRPVVPIEHTLITTGIVLHGQPGAPQGQISTPSLTFTYTPGR